MSILALLVALPWLGSPTPAEAPSERSSPLRSIATLDVASEEEEATGIAWFEGDWAALLERARAEDRRILLEYSGADCAWCERLHADTWTDARVVRAVNERLAFRVDRASALGAELGERYGLELLPTLAFLEPDGALRDLVLGYRSPEALLPELARIASGAETLAWYARAIEARPDDLARRYAFAQKLRAVRDLAGARAQEDEIRRRDPECRTLAARRLRFRDAEERAQRTLEAEPLRALVAEETDRALAFALWSGIRRVEFACWEAAETDAAAAPHLARWHEASRALWTHADDAERKAVGNTVAWDLWLVRDYVDADAKRFALEVGRAIAALAPEEPDVLETFACVQYLNGRRAEAVRTIERAIRLEPDEAAWRERRQSFLRD